MYPEPPNQHVQNTAQPPTSSSIGTSNVPIVSGNFQLPPAEKRPKKKIPFGLIIGAVIVLIAGSVFLIWPTKTTPKTPAAQKTHTLLAKPAAPVVTTPHVTSGTATTLGLGTFTVGAGKDVVPGFYSVTPGPEQSGDFLVVSSMGNFDATLDNIAADPYGTHAAWALLTTGDKLHISGSRLQSVAFRPVPITPSDPPILSKLYTATFDVSSTASGSIHPGKLLTKSDPGVIGDILIISKDYTIKYSQKIDNTGFVADLVDGDEVAVANVTKITLSPAE